MATTLVDPTLLFEFAIELGRWEPAVHRGASKRSSKSKLSTVGNWAPSERHLLPHFAAVSGAVSHSSVYAAWSEAGLYFHCQVRGKLQPPRYVQPRGGFSDGLRVWIDTRCSPGIHRATRYCHCFHFFPGLPAPAETLDGPHAILDEIPRARELPAAIADRDLEVQSAPSGDGYSLWAHVPARCLTGYSPLEFDRISLFYDVVDNELGIQSMTLGPELRYAEDPSLWVQAKLTV